MLLLVVLPAIALAVGLGFYLSGGRYISTDNAYVGRAEGADHARHFRQGAVACWCAKANMSASATRCSRSIPCPFQLALQQAQSKLDTVAPISPI